MTTLRKYLFPILLVGAFMLTATYFYIKEQSRFNSSQYLTQKEVTVLEKTPECILEEEVTFYRYADPVENPKNNKFGIYVYAENADFFELAQNLVNSNGGSWGYVLIPYNIDDRDSEKWERVFDQLRSKQLIPVIQLHAEKMDNYKDRTEGAAKFLSQFIWPIKDRYISVYNEMNDSRFWFGKADPDQYAQVLDFTIDTFKKASPNYKIMNGALNISAATGGGYIDGYSYLRAMNEEKPGIFEKLDYWASHPYPQPGFRGYPEDTGRNSITAYRDELKYLKDTLKVDKQLKVFITETGWAHAEGESYNSAFYSVAKVAELFKTAYEDVWLKDDLVIGVMPFTIRYDVPFDHFSWVNKDGVPYLQYETIKSIKKVSGTPQVLVPVTEKTKKCN